MRVAVIGVSGYLGGLITRSLDFDPNVASILGLDIVPPKHIPKRLVFREAEVRHEDFRGLFQGVDVVYHLAFMVEPPKTLSMREIDEINIEGSRRVFEGAMAGGVRKIIYASSVMAYGTHEAGVHTAAVVVIARLSVRRQAGIDSRRNSGMAGVFHEVSGAGQHGKGEGETRLASEARRCADAHSVCRKPRSETPPATKNGSLLPES